MIAPQHAKLLALPDAHGDVVQLLQGHNLGHVDAAILHPDDGGALADEVGTDLAMQKARQQE